MDILDSLRQAPSAELYSLYLAIGKMLDDPRRTLEIRQRLHLGMAVNYIGDDPLGAYFGKRDHGFRLNVIGESGGR